MAIQLSLIWRRMGLTRRIKEPLRRLIDGGGRDVNQAVNEESFWDYYVKNWEQSETLNTAEYLGNEWKHEEHFLSLLTKYASSDKRALEIGCGGGRITARGVTLFRHVYAADLSSQMLKRARQAVDSSNVSFHKLDGFTLKEFADASVEFVYSHDVFVQMSSMQIYPYLIEIGRVLPIGGIGLVSCYDFVDRFDLFKKTSMNLWNQRIFPVTRRLHFVTEQMLRVMLADFAEMLEIHRGRFLTIVFRKVDNSAALSGRSEIATVSANRAGR